MTLSQHDTIGFLPMLLTSATAIGDLLPLELQCAGLYWAHGLGHHRRR